jgi:hypothetical protein
MSGTTHYPLPLPLLSTQSYSVVIDFISAPAAALEEEVEAALLVASSP